MQTSSPVSNRTEHVIHTDHGSSSSTLYDSYRSVPNPNSNSNPNPNPYPYPYPYPYPTLVIHTV